MSLVHKAPNKLIYIIKSWVLMSNKALPSMPWTLWRDKAFNQLAFRAQFKVLRFDKPTLSAVPVNKIFHQFLLTGQFQILVLFQQNSARIPATLLALVLLQSLIIENAE